MMLEDKKKTEIRNVVIRLRARTLPTGLISRLNAISLVVSRAEDNKIIRSLAKTKKGDKKILIKITENEFVGAKRWLWSLV